MSEDAKEQGDDLFAGLTIQNREEIRDIGADRFLKEAEHFAIVELHLVEMLRSADAGEDKAEGIWKSMTRDELVAAVKIVSMYRQTLEYTSRLSETIQKAAERKW